MILQVLNGWQLKGGGHPYAYQIQVPDWPGLTVIIGSMTVRKTPKQC